MLGELETIVRGFYIITTPSEHIPLIISRTRGDIHLSSISVSRMGISEVDDLNSFFERWSSRLEEINDYNERHFSVERNNYGYNPHNCGALRQAYFINLSSATVSNLLGYNEDVRELGRILKSPEDSDGWFKKDMLINSVYNKRYLFSSKGFR